MNHPRLLSDGTKPPELPPWFRLLLKIVMVALIVVLIWAMRPLVYVGGYFVEYWRMNHRR
jgi:hypothetical protein